MKKIPKVKDQKGSITLFILLSVLLFLVVVVSVSVSTKNKEASINTQIAKVKSSYEKDVGNEKQIYTEKINKVEPETSVQLTIDPNGGKWNNSEEKTVIKKEDVNGDSYTLGEATPSSITFDLDGGDLDTNLSELKFAFTGWNLKHGRGSIDGTGSNSKYIFGDKSDTAIAQYSSITLPGATKEGYNFDGWYKGDILVGVKNDTYPQSGGKFSETTLTAHWTQKQQEQNIVLAFIDASGTRNVTPDQSGTATAPDISTKEGNWNSLYWTLGEESDSAQAVASGGTINNANADATYYARYEKSVLVSFDLNGSTDTEPDSISGKLQVNSKNLSDIKPASITLPNEEPSRNGYSFAGWNTKEDGTGIHYNKGSTGEFTEDTTLYAEWSEGEYALTIDPNGGTVYGNTTPKVITTPKLKYNSTNWNEIDVATREGYILNGYYDAQTGGEKVYNENGKAVKGSTYWNNEGNGKYIGTSDLTVYAHWTEGIYAEYNGDTFVKYYGTLAEALSGATSGNTIKVLVNKTETTAPSVASEKTLTIDLNGNTTTLNGVTLTNSGTLKIKGSGTLTTSSAVNLITNSGILNLEHTGTISNTNTGEYSTISNTGTVNVDGSGTVSSTTPKSTIEGGNISISSGIVLATNGVGIYTTGSLTLGTNEATPDVSTTSPSITGSTYGVQVSGTFNFYDGVIVGAENQSINGTVTNTPTGYKVAKKNNDSKETAKLSNKYIVTFDANEGEVSPSTKEVTYNNEIGTLPTPTRTNYIFDGWYTERTEGTKITSSTLVTNDVTYYAHWDLVAITFEDKTITKTFSTEAQTVNDGVDVATGGTGTYSYAITAGNESNYFSLSGRNLTIAQNTPANTSGYEITITATDSGSGATANATYTIKINKKNMTTPEVSINTDGEITWGNVTGATSYEVKIGSGEWETATSGSKSISTSSTGTKTAKVRAVTTNGNYNTPSEEGTASKEVYSLTLNKGTGISNTSGAGNYVEGKQVSIDATVSSGYEWKEWTKQSGTSPASATTKNTTVTIGANTELTATTTKNNYTITLKAGTGVSTVALDGWANTGTDTMTKNLEYGDTLDLSTVTVTNATGYSGATWAKTSGEGTLSGTTFTVGTGVATLTVTAEASEYTITLNNQSATSAGTSEIYETYGVKYSKTSGGEAMTTSANGISVPTRTSYAFGGYYTEKNGAGDQIIDANGFLTAGASTTQFDNDGTLYAKWTDSANPTLSVSKETYHEGFEDWKLSGGAYIDSNGALILPNSESVAKSRHYQAEEAWNVMYDAYTSTAVSGSKGGSYFKSEYYDSTLTNINNKNGVASDDWKNTNLTLSEWTNLTFSSNNKMYGGNIKYITLQFEENSSYAKTPERIKNFKVRGQLWSGFYDIKITASDGQSGINTIKYDSGNRSADYFETEGTVVSNNVIRVTENGIYTVCAEDKAGNRTVKTVTINKIDITGPTTTAPTYTKTANSITVTNSQADSESGIYKVEYAIKESGGEYGNWQSSNEFTGLRSSTTYVVKTRAINKAYLKSVSSETTVTTDTIEYTITLDNQGATTAGTGSIYEIYENRYSLTSGGVAMTSSENPITKPEKTGHQFAGYYTEQNGQGTQVIDANGYITSSASNTLFNSNDTIYANWSTDSYMVSFDACGGTTNEPTRSVAYNTAVGSLPTAQYTNHIFKGWYTEPSGGTQIAESTTITETTIFYAQWEDAIAEISGTYYPTLTDAVAAVTTSDATTIKLVNNTSENITISASQNITFDFGTNTLSNNGANVVIDNNGTLTFTRGTITTNANQIAVNNNSGATLYITGGTIESTGTEQAVYNNGGTVEISGGHISAIAKYENSNKRGTVHNQSGTMEITGGTIVSPYKTYGGYNTGVAVTTKVTTLTVGIKDGLINTASPEIVGERYGINNEVAFNIYDGNIKGKNGTTAALVSYASNKIGDKETNYKISHGTVDSYDCVFFVATHKVTFNPNGGSVATTSKNIEERKPLGELPVPTRAGYAFQGWFTEKTYGDQVTAETLMGSDDITYYAHWEASPPAEVDSQQYDTIQKAIDSNASGVEVEVIADATESITIPKNKEVTINLNGHSLSNNGTSILKNNGILTITGGMLNTNRADASSIDNNPGGILLLDGVRIIAIGTDTGTKNKQALYNDNGRVTIRGNSYFESKTSGSYNSVPRGTIHNINGATMTIESATVINNLPLTLTPNDKNPAVSNGPNSTLIIGIKDGLYNQNSPTFIGRKYGIYNAGTLKYYDGTFSGITASTYSTAAATSEIEDYYDPDDTTEEITLEGETQSATYHKRFLLAPITITPSTLEPAIAPITATIRYNSIIVSGMKAGFGSTLAEAEANANAVTADSVTITGNGYVYAEGIDSDGETRIETLQITNIID